MLLLIIGILAKLNGNKHAAMNKNVAKTAWIYLQLNIQYNNILTYIVYA